jgi:hypothetical protein
MLENPALPKTAKDYEAWIAREIEKCRALGVEASDEQFRDMLTGRLLGCMIEALRASSPSPAPDDKGSGLQAV